MDLKKNKTIERKIISILRVQNSKNEGYNSSNAEWTCYDEEHNHTYDLEDGIERHMHPDADHGTPLGLIFLYLKKNNPFIFGFKNKIDLYIWFCKCELDILAAAGFYVYSYEVYEDAIVHGSRQLIFDKNHVIKITKL